MHFVRLLQHRLPELLVEQRALPRTRGAAAGEALDQRQPRRAHRRTSGHAGRPVPALPLPYHHELRQDLSEGAEPREGDRGSEETDGGAAGLARPFTRPPFVPATAGTHKQEVSCRSPGFPLARERADLRWL